jgi:hypothetical protein
VESGPKIGQVRSVENSHHKTATLVSKIIPSDSISDRLEFFDQIYTYDHLTFHST